MIGIFGGTFDPVHHGHLRVALDVLEALQLTELRFVPLGQAVHRDQPSTPAQQRLAQLRAAIDGQPGFCIDTRELYQPRPSYTVHTLESLRHELGRKQSLCLLLGQDAFAAFHSWHQPERILQLAHLVVMQRPGYQSIISPELAARFEVKQTNEVAALRQQAAGLVLFQPVTQLNISSSDIRQRLAQGRSVRYLLPEAVRTLLESR